MPGHPHGPLADVNEYVGVEDHHNDKGNQVEDGPEDQVGIAVEWCHVGAGADVADAVPAHAGDGAHDNRHGPDDDDHHHHPTVAHARVQLHAEDGDVPFDGDGQEVGHRGRQAGVDESLAEQPGADGQPPCVGSRVEHEVKVGQTGEEVGRRQVGHEIVDGEVETAVHVDGHHDQQVGQHDEDAHRDAQSHHQLADCVPLGGQKLPTAVVKEGDGLVVVALSVVHGVCLLPEDDKST